LACTTEKKEHRIVLHNQKLAIFAQMESSEKTNGHGGYREGAGAKQIYGEPTVNITFRVPASHRSTIRRMVYDYMDGLKVKRKHEPEYGC